MIEKHTWIETFRKQQPKLIKNCWTSRVQTAKLRSFPSASLSSGPGRSPGRFASWNLGTHCGYLRRHTERPGAPRFGNGLNGTPKRWHRWNGKKLGFTKGLGKSLEHVIFFSSLEAFGFLILWVPLHFGFFGSPWGLLSLLKWFHGFMLISHD